jgi:hypothetical protein
MTCYEIWSLYIQVALAVGTFLVAIIAIIIAVWGDSMRAWGFSPKLKVSLLTPQGERNDLEDGTLCRNYHLKVTNDRKRSPARNVQVFLTKIFRPAADGKLVDRSFSGPLQLTWQFPQDHPQTLLIGPDRVCDLGRITRWGLFELMLYINPNSFERNVAATEKIQVEIIAVAENAESKPIRIEIAWDGIWSDDTIDQARHLVVKEVLF